jgi:hypothetical protein
MKQYLIALAVLVAACSSSRPDPGVVDAPMHSHKVATPSPTLQPDELQPDEFDAAAPISVAEAAKAAGSAEVPAETDADADAIYACPMHPEVTSATPGKCPKCGMTLIKRDKK